MREHKERMSLCSSLVLFQVRKECLSFHLGSLPLGKDMFVAPVGSVLLFSCS